MREEVKRGIGKTGEESQGVVEGGIEREEGKEVRMTGNASGDSFLCIRVVWK